MKRAGRRSRLAVAVALSACVALGARCVPRVDDPGDPLLHRDFLDTVLNRAAEVMPGLPWMRPGPDGELGSEDDGLLLVYGDSDLVVRAGVSGPLAQIPLPSPLRPEPDPIPLGVVEPLGGGFPVVFEIFTSSGRGSIDDPAIWLDVGGTQVYVPALGQPAAPPYLVGMPVVAMAFPDLDGDGFVGVTALDGDAGDALLEEAELLPVGRTLVLGAADGIRGALQLSAGGPPGLELEVALTAVAYAGSPRADFFGGNVPDGPAVMTHLPFFPRTDPQTVIDAGPQGPDAPASDDLLAVQIEPLIAPDDAPWLGEALTLRLDGSDPTIDVARSASGAFSRYGFVRSPDPTTYRAHPARPLRPALDDAGARITVEVLQRLSLADDGSGSVEPLRLVPLDRLGNVTAPPFPDSVLVRSGGEVRIVVPDLDGDPYAEVIPVADERGALLWIDDAGGVFDDAGPDVLVADGGGGLSRIPVFLPDPDVDDSGLVDSVDRDLVRDARNLDLGEPGYAPELDLDGNGRIDDDDVTWLEAFLGQVVAIP